MSDAPKFERWFPGWFLAWVYCELAAAGLIPQQGEQ